MQIHYLEIVTDQVDAVCATYCAALGVTFSEPIAALGNASTAATPDGGMIGVRAPMSETEGPTTRPYWLVDDLESALSKVVASGAEIAHPPMALVDLGTFAIYTIGGVQQGFWQR